MASRCFRKESRRVILAFAKRTASVLVRFLSGWGVFFHLSTVGIKGNTGVAIFEARSIGCVFIGPVTLGILDNSICASLFKRKDTRHNVGDLFGAAERSPP
jgi:hypothetical protein